MYGQEKKQIFYFKKIDFRDFEHFFLHKDGDLLSYLYTFPSFAPLIKASFQGVSDDLKNYTIEINI